MPTNPVTYRISPEVDAELKRLAQIHGGTDKALRVMFGWTSPLASQGGTAVSVESVARGPDNHVFNVIDDGKPIKNPRSAAMIVEPARATLGKQFKGPIPKPKDKKK